MDLERLNKALSTYEVALHLYNSDGGKTLSEALALLQKANEEAGNPLSLTQVMKNTPNARSAPKIVLGKNKTDVIDNRNPKKDSTKSYDAAADRVSKIAQGMASEDTIPWINRTNAPNAKVKVIKDACRKARAASESTDPYRLNHVAESILRSRAKLNETAVAAKTLATHPLASEPSVKNSLPKEFRDSGLDKVQAQKNLADANDIPAIRMPTWNVKASLPREFQPAPIGTDVMNASGRMKSPTEAAETIKRRTNPDFKNQEIDQELPQVPTIEPPLKDGESMARLTLKNHQNQQRQWDVDLKSPRPPKQGSSSINGAA